ncbi:YicC family protein [Alcaligenaceae bacterium 429]|uniref:YicC/YloC family endoribonuclease n=1 Tax=Paenalcaligenes sp. Me52 TaxID=3392038 RepID=UPI00109212CC|nr:YicC family protein [Alcaligenaceae bacterium 429]
MISSMTAFGSARAESELGSITIDLRSVNNRYLDLNLRIPEELRFLEAQVRERLSESLQRGKIELRLSFHKNLLVQKSRLDPAYLEKLAAELALARSFIPDTPAPKLQELMQSQQQEQTQEKAEQWQATCLEALGQALQDFQAARLREGERLAADMLTIAEDIQRIVADVEQHIPQMLQDQQNKISDRLRESLNLANPEGFSHISGEELSARIAQEASLFSLRSDVAEELTRLRSHLKELQHILQGKDTGNKRQRKGSSGKRLDFLFQEMNREANTLGSKAGSLTVTEAAIDLKLLIEQMREQAQNIE